MQTKANITAILLAAVLALLTAQELHKAPLPNAGHCGELHGVRRMLRILNKEHAGGRLSAVWAGYRLEI